MLKAGLILGGVMLVLGTIGGFLPFGPILCVPCLAILSGAGAGAIGGVGAIIAHLISGLAGAAMTGPEGGAELLRQMGIDVGNVPVDPANYWGGAIGTACCFGLFEVILMAALGALGGFIWYQTPGSKSAGTPAAPAM